MKQILLTIVNAILLTCGVYSQDTLATNVYQKINELRSKNQLSNLIIDEPLELASAQHGCWLGLYNIVIDTNKVVLVSEENDVYVVAKKFKSPEDRIKNFTKRNFNSCKEYINCYYTQPTSDQVFDFMSDKITSPIFTNQGFWIIKFETVDEKPIWYLIYLLTD
jgi:hypothetical protein